LARRWSSLVLSFVAVQAVLASAARAEFASYRSIFVDRLDDPYSNGNASAHPPAGHIFHNSNPSLRLVDLNGVLAPQQGWSNDASANPVPSERDAHLNNVVNDVAANDAVDGIRLDYIRYIPVTPNFSRLPHDPISHQMFLQASGSRVARTLAANQHVKSRGGDATPQSPPTPGQRNVLDDFEVDEGHFHWAYDASPASQTFGLTGDTSIERVTNQAQAGAASQLINVVSNGSGEWQIRHNSGLNIVAHPTANVPLAAAGYIGFWLKTDNPGITVRLGVDDPVGGNTALEHGVPLDVIADNRWHLYQWNLDDADHWIAFAGGANGVIDGVDGTVTVDSIWLSGAGNAQIYLDSVSHNPSGTLVPEPPAVWLAAVLAMLLLLLAIRDTRRMSREARTRG
jgi:hypothetical protein